MSGQWLVVGFVVCKICIYCTSSYRAELFATGEIRQNIKFVSFWCVVLTKIKVGPESW